MGRVTINNGEVFHKNFMGPGSGLDADTVDGVNSPAMINSDRSLKREIGPIDSAFSADDVAALLVKYRYNHEDSPQSYGVIAQDLQAIPALKELVRTMHPGTLGIEPFSLLFYLVNALAVELVSTKAELQLIKEGLSNADA